MLRNGKKIKEIIRKVYGNGKDVTYMTGRSYSSKDGIYTTFGLCFSPKPWPNECPDLQRMAAFVEECKNIFGDDCPQTKAYVWYSEKEKKYYLMWEEKNL